MRFLTQIYMTLAQREIVRAHFWQTLANYTQNAGGMLLGIVLARLLEPAAFGQFILVGASLSILMIPASFSTAQILVSDGGKTPGLFLRVLGMAGWVCLLKLLILTAFIGFSLACGKSEQASIAILIGLPMALADWLGVVKSDLEGRGIFYPNFLVQAANLVAQAITTITLALHGWGMYALALGALAALIPETLIYTALTDRKLASPCLSLGDFKAQFRLGFWLWLGSVTSNWYSRVDKLFLGHFGGVTQLAFYNRAMNYGPISHTLLNSLMTNVTIRSLATKGTNQGKKRVFKKTAAIVLIGGISNGLFWYFFAEPLVGWVFGEPWKDSAPVFQVLSWLGLPYFLVYGSSTILYAQNDFRTIAIVHLFGLSLFSFGAMVWGMTAGITAIQSAILFVAVLFLSGGAMSAAAFFKLKEKLP